MSPLRELLLDLLESGIAVCFGVLLVGYVWGMIDDWRAPHYVDPKVAAEIERAYRESERRRERRWAR